MARRGKRRRARGAGGRDGNPRADRVARLTHCDAPDATTTGAEAGPTKRGRGAWWQSGWTFGVVVLATAANPTFMAPLLPWTLGGAFVLHLLDRGYLGSIRP